MKQTARQFAVEQLPRELAELVEAAQCERVVLTRNGAPYALIVGVEHKDQEDLQLETSPEFWQMIAERRRETHSIPLEEFMAGLEADEKRVGGADGTATANRGAAESAGTGNTQE